MTRYQLHITLQLVAAISFCASQAMAQSSEWGPMKAQDLAGLKLVYENAWQDFCPTGRTLYNAGEDSWGYWQDQGGDYCSQWPPRNEWTCYKVERNGDQIRFIAEGGHITPGRIE